MEIVEAEQAAGSLLFASLLVLVVFFIALRAGYFRLPPPEEKHPVTFRQTFGVFLTYLALAFLVLPVINVALVFFVSRRDGISKEWLGWAQISSLFIVFFCLVGYCFLIRRDARSTIFWGGDKPTVMRTYKSIWMGLVSFLVSYPFVFWTGIVTSLISVWIWGEAKVEQVAVKQLKMAMGRPVMFSLMAFLVIILLKRYVGRMWSLFSTAAIFALFHFAASQGTGNFQLIISLFVLSIFLGFVYERERTLWAPIALHSAFNGFSVLLIIISKG
jgi:hypothetical protein